MGKGYIVLILICMLGFFVFLGVLNNFTGFVIDNETGSLLEKDGGKNITNDTINDSEEIMGMNEGGELYSMQSYIIYIFIIMGLFVVIFLLAVRLVFPRIKKVT